MFYECFTLICLLIAEILPHPDREPEQVVGGCQGSSRAQRLRERSGHLPRHRRPQVPLRLALARGGSLLGTHILQQKVSRKIITTHNLLAREGHVGKTCKVTVWYFCFVMALDMKFPIPLSIALFLP